MTSDDTPSASLPAPAPAAPAAPPSEWAERPLADLIDHIVRAHHVPVADELARLAGLAAKVRAAQRLADGRRHRRIAALVGRLRAEVTPHLVKEEELVFPAIRIGVAVTGPIAALAADHRAALAVLRALRELTWGYTPPETADPTWIALWQGLAAFDADLGHHIELEDGVLFPRAMELSRR